MAQVRTVLAKGSYGFLFMVLLPLVLVIWTSRTANLVQIPCPASPAAGYILLGIGLLLVVIAMHNLLLLGKGLPMNAFPPEKFVTSGVYAILKHPIYLGALLVSFGISLTARSSSGFWLVSPLFGLLEVVYVVGFENERTAMLFGPQHKSTLFSLPVSSATHATKTDRVVGFVLVFLPWILVYEAFIFAGIPRDAVCTNLPMEHGWPVWEGFELPYAFTYLYAMAIPLIPRSRMDLRAFIKDAWLATILAGLAFLLLPFITQQRTFIPHSFLGNLILFERATDGETAAFPSFHVIWAFLAARVFSQRFPGWSWLWYCLAVLIAVSCSATGNHSVPDVLAGFAVFLLVVNRKNLWNLARRGCEAIGNSWKEWRLGPIRIINHGLYAGAAGAMGITIVGCFLGGAGALAGFIIGVMAIVGAALWAQLIEGSPRLLRPYGYYGSVAGVVAGTMLLHALFHFSLAGMLAAFSLAAPWNQCLGRMRCLVQGCCHGKPSPEMQGIRFFHPLSRVNKIAGLSGAYIYPTQLYSIACNLITGCFLLRLYSLQMPATFITGMYFILNGAARFVEESFRGEPQTPYWAGMRLYQWIALLAIAAGIMFTCFPSRQTLVWQPNWLSVGYGFIMFMFATFAYGVDFPASNRRFARLTSN